MNLYGISSMKSVDFDRGEIVEAMDVIKIISDRLGTKRLLMCGGKDNLGSSYRGYINAKEAYIAPYNGKYGKGFICCTHSCRSSLYMDVCYYIREENQKGEL